MVSFVVKQGAKVLLLPALMGLGYGRHLYQEVCSASSISIPSALLEGVWRTRNVVDSSKSLTVPLSVVHALVDIYGLCLSKSSVLGQSCFIAIPAFIVSMLYIPLIGWRWRHRRSVSKSMELLSASRLNSCAISKEVPSSSIRANDIASTTDDQGSVDAHERVSLSQSIASQPIKKPIVNSPSSLWFLSSALSMICLMFFLAALHAFYLFLNA